MPRLYTSHTTRRITCEQSVGISVSPLDCDLAREECGGSICAFPPWSPGCTQRTEQLPAALRFLSYAWWLSEAYSPQASRGPGQCCACSGGSGGGSESGRWMCSPDHSGPHWTALRTQQAQPLKHGVPFLVTSAQLTEFRAASVAQQLSICLQLRA